MRRIGYIWQELHATLSSRLARSKSTFLDLPAMLKSASGSLQRISVDARWSGQYFYELDDKLFSQYRATSRVVGEGGLGERDVTNEEVKHRRPSDHRQGSR